MPKSSARVRHAAGVDRSVANSRPMPSWSMISVMPPSRVPTTGVPHARASASASPKASL
jgi:hypothetical protein